MAKLKNPKAHKPSADSSFNLHHRSKTKRGADIRRPYRAETQRTHAVADRITEQPRHRAELAKEARELAEELGISFNEAMTMVAG